LYVRGRDIEECEHAVIFDKHSCKWTILGTAAEIHRSNERGKILDALLNATEPLTPQEIAASTGMSSNNIWQLLFKMVQDGEAVKVGRGKYRHPDRPYHPPTPDKDGDKDLGNPYDPKTVTPDKDDKEVRTDEI
jgi:biotin operon repressor